MKQLFILFSLLSMSYSFAQTSFFYDKKGKKTIMRDDTVEILVVDDRLSYAENGKDWEKYIRFKDLDYAIVGPYVFKSYILIDEKKDKTLKETAYFLVAETKTRKLLSKAITTVTKYGSSTTYHIFAIDNDNKVQDYIIFNTSNIYINARGKITPLMKKNFSDCPEVMDKFLKFDDNDDKHLNVLGFFDSPEYIKCK